MTWMKMLIYWLTSRPCPMCNSGMQPADGCGCPLCGGEGVVPRNAVGLVDE